MARLKKQAERFKVTPFINPSGTTSWRVSGTDRNGKRIRENYDSQPDALLRKSRLEGEYHNLPNPKRFVETLLSPEQIADAEAAQNILFHRPMASIASEYIYLDEIARRHGRTVVEAMQYFDEHYRDPIKSITLKDAVDQFLSTRTGIARTTKKNYSNSLKLLTDVFPAKAVHKVTLGDLDATLGEKSLGSQRSHRGRVSTFFEWAVKRSYCSHNPCKKLDSLNADMTQIAVLSLGEVKRLLKAATVLGGGRMVATVAIGLFAGLRPSEIRDLKPSDIREDRIFVSGGKLRRQHKRVVQIPEVLKAWLTVYPFNGLPGTLKRDYEALKKSTEAHRWVKDIVRHTSISFHYARDKSMPLVADACGTSVKEINRHYLQIIVVESDVHEFWNLTPESIDQVRIKSAGITQGPKRVKWPSPSTLRKWLNEENLSSIGRKLGCSANAVKKHCGRVGIDLEA